MRQILFSIFIVIIWMVLGACSPSSAELELEEHPLADPPEPETLSFTPLQGTQGEILALHEQDRAMVYSEDVIWEQGNPAIASLGEDRNLLAVLETSEQGQPEQTAKLLREDTIIFETPAGLPSPAMPLQGLWAYDGHWALEILFADPNTWAGQVFIDGELVNELQGYDEAFGFQLLAGKPFFFYNRDGKLGYSYDGQETALDYDEIPHYRCCSESSLNPIRAQNMVAFFAVKDGTWSYVELGDFSE